MASATICVPLNRVEGDLEVRAQISDGVVVEAWCSGTMYRGFENIMVGRGAMDGLIITPRICGICSTSHLTAAARALEQMMGAVPPPDAVRVRNLALMTEHIQSDIRQSFLMFAPDLTNAAYASQPLYDEAVRRYTPFAGTTYNAVLRETKRVLEIVAILGGQWPHASFVVPGGIAAVPSDSDLLQCRLLLRQYRQWYEKTVLGCSLEQWLAVRSTSDLEAWLNESESHRDSELGFMLRFGRAIGLDSMGQGPGHYLSFGGLDLPQGTKLRVPMGARSLLPAGFASADSVEPLSQDKILEDITHSWFESSDDAQAHHPTKGQTKPYATGQEAGKYSWAKAPRYDGMPAETGPLAELVVAEQPLIVDLLRRHGSNALVRQLARLIRPAELIGAMEQWLGEVRANGRFYESPPKVQGGEGMGLVQASRGALGHWVRIDAGKISRYQIITPTAWNASPRDGRGQRGPMEQALCGAVVRDLDNPVELGHVVRSFDPCLVCTVHALDARGRQCTTRVGG